MIKVVFTMGLVMTLGSGAMAYDYTQQSGKTPGQTLDFVRYAADLQFRVVDLMEKEVGPRIASLPQIARGMSTGSLDKTLANDLPSTRQQIDDFAEGSSQLQAMVKADRVAAKESWWARIRHKVIGGNDTPRADRLGGIRERNFPKPRQGIEPSDISGMSATQLYGNRAAISEGLSNTAANRMNAATEGMDMSLYSNQTLDW